VSGRAAGQRVDPPGRARHPRPDPHRRPAGPGRPVPHLQRGLPHRAGTTRPIAPPAALVQRAAPPSAAPHGSGPGAPPPSRCRASATAPAVTDNAQDTAGRAARALARVRHYGSRDLAGRWPAITNGPGEATALLGRPRRCQRWASVLLLSVAGEGATGLGEAVAEREGEDPGGQHPDQAAGAPKAWWPAGRRAARSTGWRRR
jgi:hypothetical protein